MLIKNNVDSKTHTGQKAQFNLHFVKTDIIDKEYGKLYSDLMDWRGKGDYDDFVDFTKEIVEPIIEPVQQFINIIDKLVRG